MYGYCVGYLVRKYCNPALIAEKSMACDTRAMHTFDGGVSQLNSQIRSDGQRVNGSADIALLCVGSSCSNGYTTDRGR